MIVRIIGVTVNDRDIDEFKVATAKNHEGSIREPGVLRFDVVQSVDNPAEFVLYEVYKDEQSTVAHKETSHYAEWKATVTPMMAKDRTSGAYQPVVPVDEKNWVSSGAK